jgi:hypothetical protein
MAETAPAHALSSTTAAVRKNGGCQDINDDSGTLLVPPNIASLFPLPTGTHTALTAVKLTQYLTDDVVIFGDVNPALLSPSIMQNIYEFVTVRGGGLIFMAGLRYTPLAYRDTPLAPLLPMNVDTVSLPDPDRVVTEAFRAQGLQEAMYIVPALSVVLAAVLFAGARTSVRDRRALTSWMEKAESS